MNADTDCTELLRLWDQLSPEDRGILLRFAKLLLEPRLTGGLDQLLRKQPDLYEADVRWAEARRRV
jgi:hypothetical protein